MHNIQRSPLYQDSYKPTFSGHETFPLRYGWLKKAYDAVASLGSDQLGRDLFTDDSAIGRFGVGKNMVTSMRHWATCCGIIADVGKGDANWPDQRCGCPCRRVDGLRSEEER